MLICGIYRKAYPDGNCNHKIPIFRYFLFQRNAFTLRYQIKNENDMKKTGVFYGSTTGTTEVLRPGRQNQ